MDQMAFEGHTTSYKNGGGAGGGDLRATSRVLTRARAEASRTCGPDLSQLIAQETIQENLKIASSVIA